MSSNKTFSSETASRYALALYELAKENSELETVEKDIKEFLAIYNLLNSSFLHTHLMM